MVPLETVTPFLYDDYTRQLVDEDDYRRLKSKTKDEIHLLKGKLENGYQSTQQLVRERLKFTLELLARRYKCSI